EQHDRMQKAGDGGQDRPDDHDDDHAGIHIKRRHSLAGALGRLVDHGHGPGREAEWPDSPAMAEKNIREDADEDEDADSAVGPAQVLAAKVAEGIGEAGHLVRLILNLYLSLNPLPNLNLNHNPNRIPKPPQVEVAFL